MHLLNFRFIYPSERDRMPRWLIDELLLRAHQQAELPLPQTRVCRGRLFSAEDYRIDVHDHGASPTWSGPRPGSARRMAMTESCRSPNRMRRRHAARRGDRRRPCLAGEPRAAGATRWPRSAAAADILCLCGDLTNHGTVPEAEIAGRGSARLLGPGRWRCSAITTIIAARPRRSRQVLRQAGVSFLEDEVHERRRRRLRRRQGLLRRLRRPDARRVRRGADQGVRAGGARPGAAARARAEGAGDRADRGRAALRADRDDGGRRARGDLPVSRLLAARRDHRPLRRRARGLPRPRPSRQLRRRDPARHSGVQRRGDGRRSRTARPTR